MKSSTLYTNRYGDEYYWHPVDDNVYELRMSGSSLDYATIGFKRMEEDGSMVSIKRDGSLLI